MFTDADAGPSSLAANTTPASTPLQRHRSLRTTRDVTTSPTSTTISESAVSTSFRQTDDPPVRARISPVFHADRKISIRSDPALLTCFDPADKQLYDLWVPKT